MGCTQIAMNSMESKERTREETGWGGVPWVLFISFLCHPPLGHFATLHRNIGSLETRSCRWEYRWERVLLVLSYLLTATQTGIEHWHLSFLLSGLPQCCRRRRNDVSQFWVRGTDQDCSDGYFVVKTIELYFLRTFR